MKTLRLLTIMLLFTIIVNTIESQNVAINSTGAAPNASAMLDVSSTNSGLLIPRMTTAQKDAIVSPATGLLVFDTTTNSFWYWDGTQWVEFMSGNNNDDWHLDGNSGTTAGTNFLGTTDNVSLDFRTNNSIRMRITNTGNVGIGTTAPAANLEVDGGTNTSVIVVSDDSGASTINLYGVNQGTGRVYVGQSTSYGGGIEYNGDNNPVTTGAGADYITLFRRSAGTDYWTARNRYNTNNWEFRGDISMIDGVSYNWPNVQGASNSILTNDGSGNLTWQNLSQNTYGTNNQGVSGTTNITLNTTAWVDMSQMTITFTPVHNVVYVYFTFSAYANPYYYPMMYCDFRILRNGVNVGGSNCLVEDYDDVDGLVTSFNGSLSLAVPVTAGASTTIKVQWRRNGLYTGPIYCNPASEPEYSHRSLVIID